MDSCLPQICYVCEKFLVFDKNHAAELRRRRIVGQLVGSPPSLSQQIVTSSLPYHLSQYAANLALELRLATIHKLVEHDNATIEQNVTDYEASLSSLMEEAKREHFERRKLELRRRNIEPSESRLGTFDDTRMKLTVGAMPKSNYQLQKMDNTELQPIFDRLLGDKKTTVYRDLYQRGFYITSGAKFGCDFLAYPGDPVLYHSKFALRIMPELAGGSIDLAMVDVNELNALHRLCHTANKVLLFAVILYSTDRDGRKIDLVEYWTIKTKEYLSLESKSALIKYPIDSLDGHDGVSSDHDHSQLVRG